MQNQDIPNIDLFESKSVESEYADLLLNSGYNPNAKGLIDILKRMHNASLNRALAARAFREWQQQKKPAQERKEA